MSEIKNCRMPWIFLVLMLFGSFFILGACGEELSDAEVQSLTRSGSSADPGFDNGTTNGWALTGQWHITTRRSASPPNSIWFGNEATGWFEELVLGVPVRTTGEVRKTVSFGPNPFLDFDYYLDGECGVGPCGPGGAFDSFAVQISTDGGTTWNLEFQADDNFNVPGTFSHVTLPLPVYANQTVEARFFFDSGDSINNQFEGGFIDNVVITSP